MSGIAQKSYPGSWPQSKRGETAESPSVEHEATPRTKPPLPQDIDTSGAKGDSCGQGVGSHSEGFSQNGEYTHKQQQPDGGEAEEDGDEQIKMNDVEAKEEKVTEHGTEAETAPEEMGKDIPEAQQKLSEEKPDLQEQKPEELDTEVQEKKPEQLQTEQLETEVPDKKPEQPEQSEIETKAGGDETEQPAKTASITKTSLTEMAKRAFDQASQNQPTDEARDAYLEASRAGQSQPPETEAPAAPEVEGQETPEALQKQPIEAEDDQQKLQAEPEKDQTEEQQKLQEEPEKDQTEQQQKLQEETDKDHPEAEGETAAAEEPETEPVDFSILKNGTVNKGGNVVNEDGKAVGRVTEGILKHLIGKKVDEKGNIWSTDGKIVGKAEPVSESERDELLKEPAPFESFPDAVVDKDGLVISNGEQIGKVVQGDLAILRGKAVDPDGDILDKAGNVVGKAVRWEPEPEPEPEPEVPVDKSILAGKRVNKAGNVVDGSGVIFGRVVEGDVKRMVGRMCDKNGNILSESGDILGKAELVPEGEREGLKEGPFAELEGCTVAKDGTVVTPAGDIVGRVIKGDAKILFGRAVDEDGDILDKNGNVLGKAERWEPEAVERKKNPMCGRKVNREGNVVDEDGNIIGKLTSGDLQKCSGKEIDDDGDVVDYKGNVVGHCSLIEDIPKVEEESPEDKEKREQAEQDKKLAIQMSVCIEQCLDKIRPICKMITEVSCPPPLNHHRNMI
jgi:hypothetical protein